MFFTRQQKCTAAPQFILFLDGDKRFLKSVEAKNAEQFMTFDFFIRWMVRKQDTDQVPQQETLKKIIEIWKGDIERMKEYLLPLLPVIKQFALDLKHNLLLY